jgi:hypothetical protein
MTIRMSIRARRKLIGVTVVLLVLMAAGFLVSAISQRLEFGGVRGYWPAQGVTVREAEDATEFRFAYHPDGTFEFHTSIRNPGRWPVEVNDVSLYDSSDPWGGPRYVVEELRYGYDNYDNGTSGDVYRPERASLWKPVTLAPHSVLTLFVTIKMPGDETAKGSGTIRSWETVRVSYKILGLSQERRVPIGFFLSVRM